MKRVLLAGHSLGGALATLAAYDVRALGKTHGCADNVSCITFGAPRTGNHAFARDLEQMVPDCWHVINGIAFFSIFISRKHHW